MMNLSKRGLPRPLAEHDGTLRPVPWSQGNGWGVAHEPRQRIAEVQSRCLVCGELVKEGVVFVRTDKSDVIDSLSESVRAQPIKDSYDINDVQGIETRVVEAPMHSGCAKMTRAHCKPVQSRLHEGIWLERPYKRDRFNNRGAVPQTMYA